MRACADVPTMGLRLGPAVSLCHRSDLFETLENERVVELSGQTGAGGFASPAAVLRATGVARRHILKPDVTPFDVAQELLHHLTNSTGWQPGDFSHIFLCHSHAIPDAAAQLATRLCANLPREMPAITPFNSGCTGFLQLLSFATRFLQTHVNASRVLLLNVETPDLWHCSADRLFCGIVGGGATATVLQRSPTNPPALKSPQPVMLALQDIHVQDLPVGHSAHVTSTPLFFREMGPVFSFHGQPTTGTIMRMNAESVFLHGIELMLQALRNAVSRCPVRPGQRVLVIPHQPSGKLLRALIAAAKQQFPGFHFVNNLLNHGNTISSTIPLVLAHLQDVLNQQGLEPPAPGDRLILMASGICMERMADTMATGLATFDWDPH
jgi:3-oxoacyl-[acyl-carrier-protein] synthase-3